MVDGLDERLAAKGGTADEWLRLARSRGVLGERDQASQAAGPRPRRPEIRSGRRSRSLEAGRARPRPVGKPADGTPRDAGAPAPGRAERRDAGRRAPRPSRRPPP